MRWLQTLLQDDPEPRPNPATATGPQSAGPTGGETGSPNPGPAAVSPGTSASGAIEPPSGVVHVPVVDLSPPVSNAGINPDGAPASSGDAISQLLQRQTELAQQQLAHLTRLEQRLSEPAVEQAPAENPLVALAAQIEQLQSAVNTVSSQQQQLLELYQSRLRSDELQLKAQEKLFDELNSYKTNFVRQQSQPIWKEVIACHDFVTHALRTAEQSGGPAPESTSSTLALLSQMLLDLLFKYDVEPFRSEGGAFDPKWQQCVKTIPTEDPALDKQIAEAGLTGFKFDELPLRREQVTVYRYRPPTP